jgi:tetratricopeptide (TPR) repeat protein
MTLAIVAGCLFLQGLTPEAIEHAQAGAAARQQGKLDVAIQEFKKLTELQPESGAAHASLGDAYFQIGRYDAAIPELETALRLNPNLMDTHQTLGVLLLMQGNAEGALPHLGKLHTPDLMGLAYLETGRLDKAITSLQAALDKQPNDPNLLYYFGRVTALASKSSLDHLAKVNPELARKSASATETKSPTPHAVVSLQEALAKQPNDADLLFAFGQTAALASRQSFDQILQSNANSARAHQVLAERDVEGGRLPEAEREYAESLRLRPFSSNVHLALGDVFATEGNWSAALTQYRMETKLRPASADAFYSLGFALLEQGQPAGALEELGQSDRLRPDAPKTLLALGKAAWAIHDAGRAESYWNRLLGIEKQGDFAALAHLGLSELYRQTGKPEEADREKAAYEQLTSKGGH